MSHARQPEVAFFHFFDGGFAQIFSQIASTTVKKLRNTNFISSRHVKRENTSLPVDVRRSKTLLLKLPNMRVLTVARSRLIGSCGYVIFKMAVIIKSLHENSGTRRNSQ